MDRDGRRFRRDIRLAPAEGYADIGKRECWRIVDAIADHHDRATLLELVDVARLVLGQDLRMVRIDVHAARDFLRHGLAVAGQHDDLVDAVAAHLVQRLLHLRADRVLDADDADELVMPCHVEQVLADQADIELLGILDTALAQELLAADADDTALEAIEVGDFCLHAARHDGLRALVVRRLPFMLFDVLLDSDG